jgi:hypothetical protein
VCLAPRHGVLFACQLSTGLKALALVVKVVYRIDSGGSSW